MDIIQLVGKGPQVRERIDNLEEKMPRQLTIGLAGSVKTLLLTRAFKKTNKNTIILILNLYYVNQLAEDLQHVIPQDQIHLFLVDEVLSAEIVFPSLEARGERVATFNVFQEKETGIYLLPVAALHKRLPNKKTWLQAQSNWHVGDEISVENLPRQLTLMGYVREEIVTKSGESSIRGNIVDTYPLTTDYPVRVELSDVEIDPVRYLEAETQCSIEKTEETWVPPTSEQVYEPEDLEHGIERM